MKIARVRVGGEAVWAIVDGETVYRLEGSPWESAERGAAIGPLSGAKLLAPCEPTKVVCIGLNYRAHAAESGQQVPPEPLMFLKPPTSVVGPGDDVVWAPGSEHIDYEAELAVVFKRQAKSVPAGAFKDYVLGYTCANDISARDFQRGDGQWARAKGSDTFCPLGPWIETDVDPSDLRISGKLNGETKQDSRTSDLVFDVDFLISHLTKYFTMYPGDVLITGTPAGIGPMNPGDSYEVTIEGVGSLSNTMTR
ncbi:MAG TPA: fumarylacetoacetate hydrolase family protein [Chloroflexota bacterium]|jgi:2-keto-4-pentenoate hydratase/2-oxohepta-3-ene-1,7-dioic acid hydratase in catechol pathway|nr:fumarylacetoacetate hydrolase family protein [Chloroflexota bacterium]